MKNIIIVIILITVIAIGVWQFVKDDMQTELVQATNFQECVDKGNSVMESYPRKCSDGTMIFIEDIGSELEKVDLIRLDSPRPNDMITSPLLVRGRARGYWFFEANFPIFLTNWEGLVIGQGIATAQDEWMTEEFVSFEADIQFEVPYKKGDPDFMKRGTLILQKDNPSDLPKHDDALKIPIHFMKQ